MDIFFQDPNEIPLPPEEVRILNLSAQPYPDGRRVHVELQLTPFLKRPSGEVIVTDAQGEEVAELSIIESINPRLELTVHLPNPEPGGRYTLSAEIFYAELDLPEDELEGERPPPPEPQITVVDRGRVVFTIPA